MGCSDCYDVFSQDVEKILSRIQPDINHKGKIAGVKGEQIQKANKIKDLKEKLKRAVLEERYEEAAKLRDEIKAYTDGGEHNG